MTFIPETTTEAKRKLVTPLWNAKKVSRMRDSIHDRVCSLPQH
jgi:hypothetical protein